MRNLNLASPEVAASEREPRDPHAFYIPQQSESYVGEASVPMLFFSSPEAADSAAATAVPGSVCVIGLQGPWQFYSDELNKIPLKGRTVYLAFERGETEPTPQHVLGWKLRHRGARVIDAREDGPDLESANRSFSSPFEYRRRCRRIA